MADRDVVAAIRERVDLVSLVGRNVKLRKSGSNEWVGMCPFHSERTPSFYVIPSKSICHCFGGCGHFDAFDYLMRSEGLTFPEALEQLSRDTGIELPKRERVDRKAEEHISRMRAVLAEAQDFFVGQVVSEEDAICYLQGRGLTSSFISVAGLGVAPPTWDMLVKHLQGCGFKNEEIVAAGVGAVGQRGGIIDAMRNRITIPIRDHTGKLVAFGGRVLDDAKPKYLNTKETELFKKGETLFGLCDAKAHLQDGALVVEGYFDVLTLQRLDIGNAVAPLGTALTEAHLDRLAKYTKRIILCMDGDAAGHKAMEKSLSLALPKGFDVRLLELPAGEDPDTWALSVGTEAFRELIRKAPDWTSFKLGRAVQGRDMRQTADRMAVLEGIAPFLAFVPQGQRETFFAAVSHQLQLPASEVARVAGEKPKDAIQEPEAEPARRPKNTSTGAPITHPTIKALVMSWIDPDTKQAVVDTPRSWWHGLPGAAYLEEIIDFADITPEAEALLRECDALRIIGGSPNFSRLSSSLEWAYLESEIRSLRLSMEDPRTPQDALPAYEKALGDLLTRRSRLNRGRLEPALR